MIAAQATSAEGPSEEHITMPQGTIKDFDIETGTGTVVQDDRAELTFDTETFLATGLQEFRLGQRVRFRRDGQQARDLQLISL
jgi:cold shock CspA family protein